jgi:hypothetical protein
MTLLSQLVEEKVYVPKIIPGNINELTKLIKELNGEIVLLKESESVDRLVYKRGRICYDQKSPDILIRESYVDYQEIIREKIELKNITGLMLEIR